MRLSVDKDADILSIRLRENLATDESEEVEPGVIVDYAADGQIVGVEVLSVSRRVAPPSTLVDALQRIASAPSTTDSAADIARSALAQVDRV